MTGTVLKEILSELGIHPTPECPCLEYMQLMDEWGPEGCQEHSDTIVQWLRDGYMRWHWRARLVAAIKAGMNGTALALNWRDPFPGLVQLAIKRSRSRCQFGVPLSQ